MIWLQHHGQTTTVPVADCRAAYLRGENDGSPRIRAMWSYYKGRNQCLASSRIMCPGRGPNKAANLLTFEVRWYKVQLI